MKQKYIYYEKVFGTFCFAAIFASCNQRNNDTAMYKKQVDSLTQLLAASLQKMKPNYLVSKSAETSEELILNQIDTSGEGNTIPNVMLATVRANKVIQQWHVYIKKNIPSADSSLSSTNRILNNLCF